VPPDVAALEPTAAAGAVSFGQRPRRLSITAAIAAVLGKLRPRAANPTLEWEHGKRWKGRWRGRSGGVGSQRMKVAKFLSRPLKDPKTYTGPKRNHSSRWKRRERARQVRRIGGCEGGKAKIPG
jgi:hypothetical protein